jgi:hypothetical protein
LPTALIQGQGWRGAYVWIGIGWAGLGAIWCSLLFYDAHALGQRQKGRYRS